MIRCLLASSCIIVSLWLNRPNSEQPWTKRALSNTVVLAMCWLQARGVAMCITSEGAVPEIGSVAHLRTSSLAPPQSRVRQSHGQSCSHAQCSTTRCPPPAAYAPGSTGPTGSRVLPQPPQHLQLPALEAFAHIPTISHGQSCSRAHCNIRVSALSGQRATCSCAAERGHLETLRWAREHHCPWDAWTCLRRR